MGLPALSNSNDDKEMPESYAGTVPPNYYCRGWNPKRKKYCRTRAGSRTDHPGEGRCWKHGGNNPIGSGRYSAIKRYELREAIERHERDPDPLNILPELAMTRALLEDYINRYEEFSTALLAWHASFAVAGKPLEPHRIELLQRVLEEYEIMLGERNGSAGQSRIDDLVRAKELVEFMGSPHEQRRPRRVLDIADAQKLLAEIRQQVATMENIDAQNAVSRRDLFRIMGEMGRVVETLVQDPKVKEEIEKQWLSIRLA